MENLQNISKEDLLKLLIESNITSEEISDTLKSKKQTELNAQLIELKAEEKSNLNEIERLKTRISSIKSEKRKIDSMLRKMEAKPTTTDSRRYYNPPLTVLAEKYGQDLYTLRKWSKNGTLKFDSDKNIDMKSFFKLIGHVPPVPLEMPSEQYHDSNHEFFEHVPTLPVETQSEHTQDSNHGYFEV